MGVVPPAHVEELFHDPAREVFKDRRDDRTEDEREHRILEAAVQKIQHEQRAVAALRLFSPAEMAILRINA